MIDPSQPTLIDEEIVGQLIFLAEDDPNFIRGLLGILKSELTSFQEQAARLFDQGERQTLERMVHKLSGASANLGAHALQVRLRNLQQNLPNIGPVQFKITIEEIDQLAKESIAELDRLFSQV